MNRRRYNNNEFPGPNNGRPAQSASSSSASSSHSLASSLCSSSIVELGEIFASGENLATDKRESNSNLNFKLKRRGRRRRQHTLDSIEFYERIRSRSPIVARNAMMNQANTGPKFEPINPNEGTNNRFSGDSRAELNGFVSTSGGNTDNRNSIAAILNPIERISQQSFQRRKSVFDSPNEQLSRQSPRVEAASHDELSLEHILANLEKQNSGSNNNSNERLDFLRLSLEAPTCASSETNLDSKAPESDERNQFALNRLREREISNGFEIVWLNFKYSVEPNILEDPRWGKINKLFHKQHRTILQGLSGGLKSGQMVALMGPSGAGKTCLLECISGIRLSGIEGKLYIRGRKRAQLVIVPQYDNFMPQFSVEEIIVYGSKIKNSRKTNHKQVCDDIIEQLGLNACRATNIQQCSGGQRKRVAIAQELVSKPNILILDEPTSGLDSSCCYQTMKVLRNVLDKSIETNEPMAIVTTIHQPSAKVFRMFDLIYLLGKTGLTAYSGPPGELLSTIKRVTGLECPQYSNPSDYMIELISYDYGEEPVEELIEFERRKAKQFVKDFEQRAGLKLNSSINGSSNQADSFGNNTYANYLPTSGETAKQTGGLAEKGKSETNLIPETRSQLAPSGAQSIFLGQHIEYRQNVTISLRLATSTDNLTHPFLWHTYVHFSRSFMQSIRDPILNNMRILIHIIFACLLVLLFGKKSGEAKGCPPIIGLPTEITDPNNESMIDLADNVGYLFMCIMMITYVSLMSTVLTFPIDIKTVGKEYKNGWYGTLTYFLGKTLADLPFVIVYPILYCLITWFFTNQATDNLWRFASFTRLIIMNAMNSQTFGLVLGAIFVNSVTAATFLGPVMTIPWYLFTGFTKRVHRLSEPYKTTSNFLFTRFVFEGLLDTAYGYQRCNCSEFLSKYQELRYEEAVRLGQLISVEKLSSLDYYDDLDTIAIGLYANKTSRLQGASGLSSGSGWFEKTVDAASSVFENDGEDLVRLMESNVKASSLFSFGLDFEPTCPTNYRNYIVDDFRLEENSAEKAFYLTFIMLLVLRFISFILVSWKIRTREI